MTFDIDREMEYVQTISFLKSLKDRPGSDRFPMTVALPFLRSKKDDPFTTVATSDDPPAKLSDEERTAMAQDMERHMIDPAARRYRSLSETEGSPWSNKERAEMEEIRGNAKDIATQAGALYPKYAYGSEDEQIDALKGFLQDVFDENAGEKEYIGGGSYQRPLTFSGLNTEGLWGNKPDTNQYKSLYLTPKQLIELIRINPTPDLLKRVFKDWSNGTTIGRIGAAGSYP